MPANNLEAISSSPLFQSLRSFVDRETRNFNFVCGGTIPIVSELPVSGEQVGIVCPQDRFCVSSNAVHPVEPGNVAGLPARSNLCLPVDIRWDAKDNVALSRQTKVTFPLTPETESNIFRLLEECEPATFGRGREDVFDESYRKARKMDPSHFCSTFNPYEVGIVDTIAQALLPSMGHAQRARSVKAELYKLNFYSAPLGKFDSHVDTPRSHDQFGSLVVCLPLSHRGGTLEVRHKGKTVLFDWGSQADASHPSIKWAAFYSDCEHRVLEVTEGHRLTLIYNLYVVRGNGFLGGNSPALDPTTLPLYRKIRDLMQDEILWSDGSGYIGYHCAHIYPHTASSRFHFMAPDNLKGADMAIYSICNSLGLTVSFRPALIQDQSGDPMLYEDYEDGRCSLVKWPILGADGKLEHFKIDCGDEGDDELKSWLGWINKYEEEPAPRRYLEYRDIPWLNEFGHIEDQITYMAYGNQAELVFVYSCMVMVIQIPKLERGSS